MIKNLPDNAGDIADMGSVPESGRSPEGGETHSSILAWEIPWREEPDKLQCMGHKDSDRTEAT